MPDSQNSSAACSRRWRTKRRLFWLCVLLCVLGVGCVSFPRYRTKPLPPKSPPQVTPEAEPKTHDDTPKKQPADPVDNFSDKLKRIKPYQVGYASYYANEFNGRPTASGEIFDMNALTAAHRELPLGTIIRVTDLENGKSVVVKVNDRGPFVEGRILDLSLGAARKLDMIQEGTAKVMIEIVQPVE